MIRRLVATAAAVLFPLTGCDQAADTGSAEANADQSHDIRPADTEPPQGGPAEQPAEIAITATPTVTPAAPGAPDFAVLYPGAQADSAPTVADGDAGKGGMISFHTNATPDSVVAFYQQRAEAAGMKSVMGMNQGDARAYGAADERANGASLQVVAAPGSANQTSVMLSWTEGQ